VVEHINCTRILNSNNNKCQRTILNKSPSSL